MLKRFILTILISLTAQCVFSQGIQTQNYVGTQWGMEDGLPQSSVNDIIQTQDGYIWLATFGGLVRFDGVSFTTFNRSNTPGMRSDRILHLFEDSNGIIWLNTEDGFLKFDQGVVTPYTFYVDNQIKSASRVREDGLGNLWIVVYRDIYLNSGDGFRKIEITRDESLKELALNDPNGAWLLFDKKIMRTYGDKVVEIMDLEGRITYNLIDFIEYPEASGTYFMASENEGVIRYKNGDLTIYTDESGLPSQLTRRLEKDLQGNLWVVNFLGLYIWNDGTFVKGPSILDYDSSQYLSVLEDREGNYWFGSNNAGLTRLRPAAIRTINYAQGLDFDIMLSLTQLKDGTKVFATNCGGLYEYREGRARPSLINDYLTNSCVWSVFEDSQNRIWIGSRVLYRSRSLDEPGITIGPEMGFDGVDLFAITEDSKGRIWIGAFNGIYIYENDRFTRIATGDGLSSNDTRALFEDNEGTMWAGTSNGLNKIRDGKAENITLLKNQNDTDVRIQPYVRAIYQDSEGIMWIGTYGHGIFRIKNGRVDNITQKDGLFDNIVSHIVEDDAGFFWMGSNRGISRVSKNELNEFIAGNIPNVISYSYGRVDGMKSAETNGGFQPSTISDDNGNIYFPTVRGVAVVSTKDIGQNISELPVYIENLTTSERNIPFTGSVKLDYDAPYLGIKYTALNFSDPGKTEFRYRLVGLDDNWINVGSSREALYSKIPPGNYTFEVTASKGDGVWNSEGASLAITIIPPFWQTAWFYSIIGLLLFTSGPVLYYVRIKKLRKENERQKRFTEQLIESQESERMRIASELHDGLGQQILVIKNRAELAKKQAQKVSSLHEQLDEILISAASSIQSVRTISHGLRPVHLEKFGLTEALENLCDQLQQSSETDWSYHIEKIDGLIPKDSEINFYRVIQEGTNNILKHASADEASVMVKVEDARIKAVIWDDGNGFDIYAAEVSNGLGFLGMKERIEFLKGTLSIDSETGKGTVITIEIPIADYE